jgi:hypothetical protein
LPGYGVSEFIVVIRCRGSQILFAVFIQKGLPGFPQCREPFTLQIPFHNLTSVVVSRQDGTSESGSGVGGGVMVAVGSGIGVKVGTSGDAGIVSTDSNVEQPERRRRTTRDVRNNLIV